MKLEFSRQIFEKSSPIKFHENTSSGSRVVPCGRTDVRTYVHDEANSRFSQFWEKIMILQWNKWTVFNVAVARNLIFVIFSFKEREYFFVAVNIWPWRAVCDKYLLHSISEHPPKLNSTNSYVVAE
jgi:hypothetical protein